MGLLGVSHAARAVDAEDCGVARSRRLSDTRSSPATRRRACPSQPDVRWLSQAPCSRRSVRARTSRCVPYRALEMSLDVTPNAGSWTLICACTSGRSASASRQIGASTRHGDIELRPRSPERAATTSPTTLAPARDCHSPHRHVAKANIDLIAASRQTCWSGDLDALGYFVPKRQHRLVASRATRVDIVRRDAHHVSGVYQGGPADAASTLVSPRREHCGAGSRDDVPRAVKRTVGDR